MLDVMSLREPRGTAWEATPAVAMLKRLAYRRRDRPCSRPDLDHPAVSVVGHEHATGVARDASRVFRGTMTPLQGRLARLIRIGQHLGIDVNHHLIALARGAGIEVVKGRLREQGQCIGLMLG